MKVEGHKSWPCNMSNKLIAAFSTFRELLGVVQILTTSPKSKFKKIVKGAY